jgi:TetR/AcrR family transcriptional repressor of mexJK operon
MKESIATPRDTTTAILAAALEVFGRDGFATANVDEIARRAAVAKPTIYNRFGDKRRLFVEAMRLGMTRANDRVLEAIAALDARPADLGAALQHLGLALAHCVTTEDGAAVVRLQIAEQAHFPEIDGMNLRERHLDALAGKLAQLMALGYLGASDPQIAARQFFALVTSEPLARSGYGTRPLRTADVKAFVASGVDTFLAAFGGDGHPERMRKPQARTA